TGYKELEERLQTIEKVDTVEQYIRTLFGLKSRALIAKEKAMVEKWVLTMHYDKPILEKAYEVTINNTGKPSVSYANAVLENWYKAGLSTLEEIEASIAEYQKAHEKPSETKPEGSSFDTDDFFAAALRRSYENE
ncbi:MAG: DnaD domain protein, partial [Clostridia bacterium]|nr:DnaD domain protein [Clostridia bacterium]